MDDNNQLALFVVAGLIRMCKRELNLNKGLNLTLNSSIRDVFAKAKTKGEVGNKLNYFAALKPTSIEMTEGQDPGGAAGALRSYPISHQGLSSIEAKVNQSGNQTHAIKFSLIPTKFVFTFWYATPSIQEFISFFSRWSFAKEHKRLNFTLDWLKNDLPVEVNLQKSFSIPEKEDRWESSDYSIFEGELEVFGWTSSQDKRDIDTLPTIIEAESAIRELEHSVEL